MSAKFLPQWTYDFKMTMETIVVRPEHAAEAEAEKEETEEPKAVNGENGSEETNTEAMSDAKDLNTDDNESETEEDDGGDYPDEADQEVLDEDLGMEDLPVNASLHAADEMKRRLEEIDPCEKLRALCKKGEVDELLKFLKRKEETNVDIDYISSDGKIYIAANTKVSL